MSDETDIAHILAQTLDSVELVHEGSRSAGGNHLLSPGLLLPDPAEIVGKKAIFAIIIAICLPAAVETVHQSLDHEVVSSGLSA